MSTERALQINNSANLAMLYMAMELSSKTWRLAFGDGQRMRKTSVDGGDLAGLMRAIEQAKKKFKLPRDCRVTSCYEAGRDGFWIHRYLLDRGIDNKVVDSSSIETARRGRQVKTDRVDMEKLLSMLQRYAGGEKKVWHVVRIPSIEAEDARRLHREFDRLKKERGAHSCRIRSLLVLHGIQVKSLFIKDWDGYISGLRQYNGAPLPPQLAKELKREGLRFRHINAQMLEIKQEQRECIKNSQEPVIQQVRQLMQLGAIGLRSAWVFVMEFYGWRDFKNRRQVGSLAGLTGTPYNSGDSTREQGISKAGNRRIRALIIEIAWMWLRLQPHSRLSRWYNERFATGGKRMRRVGIVALARRLLIDFWRYLKDGILPEGARLKAVDARVH